MAEKALSEYLSPIAIRAKSMRHAAPRLDTLAGKTIGFRVEWPAFEVFADYVSRRFREDYGVLATPVFRTDFAASASQYETPEWRDWRDSIDAAVLGIAA
jgi:hypothetical protein